MPSSESDWNVAARDSLTLSELLRPPVAANSGAVKAMKIPRSWNSWSTLGDAEPCK